MSATHGVVACSILFDGLGAHLFAKPIHIHQEGENMPGVSRLALGVSGALLGLSLSGTVIAEELANPGFEGGTVVVGANGSCAQAWECKAGNPKANYAFSVGAGRTGGLAQTLQTDSAQGDATLQSWVWLVPGQRYTTSLYMKADRPMEVSVILRDWLFPFTAYGMTVAKVDTTWREFHFDGIAPSANRNVEGGLLISPIGPGALTVDDASVTRVADASAGTQGRPGQVVPSAFFGMHIHRDPKWPGIGKAVGTERIWDTDAQWSAIYAQDPSAGGVPDWKAFNARVNRALLNGAELVMNLGGNAPAWATGDSPACGGASPIKSLDIWRTWVQAVATQAKGRIRYWEVWNEPYMCSALKANPALLATYVGEAYRILKQVDPSNVVLTPSFALGDQEYLDRYLQAAKAAYPSGEAFADVIAIHAYDNFAGTYLDDRVALKDPVAARSVEYMYDEKHLLLNSKVLLKKHGLENKPLWNTEAGYLGASSATGGPNDEAGAAFVARHLLLSWAAGFDRSIYYAWDQHSSVDPETKVRYFAIAGGREVKEGDQVYTTTAAGTAYAQVAKWLTGAELFSRQIDPTTGAWTLTLRRGPASSYVLWNPTGAPSSFNRPAGLTVLSDLAGVQTVSSTATVAVTPRPVLLAAPATSVSITTSAASIKVSKPVTFTAQVSGGSGPGGKVQFTLNGFNMGNPVALTNGKATLSTNAPSAPGSYAVGASYLGDAVNPPNKSSTLTETVIPLTCFGIICW